MLCFIPDSRHFSALRDAVPFSVRFSLYSPFAYNANFQTRIKNSPNLNFYSP